jgi:L-amino acid N-acyltransferase
MISLRQATAADLPALLEIYNEIILNTTAVYQYEPQTLDMRRAWYEDKVKAGYPVFVAEDDQNGSSGPDGSRIVGFSSFGPFRAWAAYQFTVENSVYVAADQRGKGIGRLLLDPLIKSARERGMHAIVAGIDATNEVSRKLHQSFGFTEVARFREVGYKFERWLDLTFLELIL